MLSLTNLVFTHFIHFFHFICPYNFFSITFYFSIPKNNDQGTQKTHFFFSLLMFTKCKINNHFNFSFVSYNYNYTFFFQFRHLQNGSNKIIFLFKIYSLWHDNPIQFFLWKWQKNWQKRKWRTVWQILYLSISFFHCWIRKIIKNMISNF